MTPDRPASLPPRAPDLGSPFDREVENADTFGKRIWLARRVAGLTVAQAARRWFPDLDGEARIDLLLNVEHGRLADWSRTEGPGAMIAQVAEDTGVNPGWLLYAERRGVDTAEIKGWDKLAEQDRANLRAFLSILG